MSRPVFAALAVLALATPAIAAPAAAPAAAVTYELGKGSEVAYDMTHPMHKVHGVTTALKGELVVANGHLVTPTKLAIAPITFDSGNANRDSNAALTLDVAKYPLTTLEITKVAETSHAQEGANVKIAGTATGKLTLHGITKAVSIPVTAVVSPTQVVVDANFSVMLTEYQIPRPSLLFRPVDDEVKLNVHAVATAR